MNTAGAGRNHAIVIGGSMAGLLAARVLSDYYQQVTIIERDLLPDEARQRRSVPQGRHTHGCWPADATCWSDIFQGSPASFSRRGAITGDIVCDARWFFEGACLTRVASGLNGLLMSRPFLEAAVRSRVLRIPNVTRQDAATVESLASDQPGRVAGVRVNGETLRADLTVDATGRGSHSPQWLESMRYEPPQEESVQIGLAYTTRFFSPVAV